MKLGRLIGTNLTTMLLAVSTCLLAPAQAQFEKYDDGGRYESPTLKQLALSLREKLPGALDEFWAQARSPMFEPIEGESDFCWITFLWRGDATTRDVNVGLGDIPTPDPSKWTFKRLADSDVWFKTDRVPKDARFSYLLRMNGGPLLPDPLNPQRFGLRSVAESPNALPQLWIAEKPGVPKGEFTRRTIHSIVLQEDRSFGIYTPAGYDSNDKPQVLVIVFDGELYGDAEDALIPTPRILDNLIAAKQIPPAVAVLVDNMNQKARVRDLQCSANFENFVTQELVPLVRSHYRVSRTPSNVVVAGSSEGGLFASFIALNHSHIFGKVLAQSADLFYSPDSKATLNAYTRDGGWLTKQFLGAHLLPLQFYLEVGLLEAGLTNPVAEHRRFRDVLRAKGYDVTYSEFSGGHDPLCWRNTFGDGLIALLGHSHSRTRSFSKAGLQTSARQP